VVIKRLPVFAPAYRLPLQWVPVQSCRLNPTVLIYPSGLFVIFKRCGSSCKLEPAVDVCARAGKPAMWADNIRKADKNGYWMVSNGLPHRRQL